VVRAASPTRPTIEMENCMSGYDLVQAWKDPDAFGAAGHPAGEIVLDELHGALQGPGTITGVLCDFTISLLLRCQTSPIAPY
jgi:hypothetical protein